MSISRPPKDDVLAALISAISTFSDTYHDSPYLPVIQSLYAQAEEAFRQKELPAYVAIAADIYEKINQLQKTIIVVPDITLLVNLPIEIQNHIHQSWSLQSVLVALKNALIETENALQLRQATQPQAAQSVVIYTVAFGWARQFFSGTPCDA